MYSRKLLSSIGAVDARARTWSSVRAPADTSDEFFKMPVRQVELLNIDKRNHGSELRKPSRRGTGHPTRRLRWISVALPPVRQHGVPAIDKVAMEVEEKFGGLLMAWWDGLGAARVFARAGNSTLGNAAGWRSAQRQLAVSVASIMPPSSAIPTTRPPRHSAG
jgi:hypothetical protein